MDVINYLLEGETRQMEVTTGDMTKPMVILIHGTGGNKRDMTDPAYLQYNYNTDAVFPSDEDIGWKGYPGIGLWSFELDPWKKVSNWRDVLIENGFSTAVYSQVDSTGFLARPVQELSIVIDVLEKNYPATKFVLLAHSRGGLLVRKFLKDFPGLATNIIKVITLHAPHSGSELSNVSQTLNTAINNLKGAFGNISSINNLIDNALGWLIDIISFNAYQEMSVGSAFIADLENGEAALPNTQYYTFGGLNVTHTRLLAWNYTFSSMLPQWHWPPFFHSITMIELPSISPVLNSLPNLVPEISDGQGDILTADSRSRLPFAIHTSNYINHAEALWDPLLQVQVLSILGVQFSFWN